MADTRIGTVGAGAEIHALTVEVDFDDEGDRVESPIAQCSRAPAWYLRTVLNLLQHVTCERCLVILRGGKV